MKKIMLALSILVLVACKKEISQEEIINTDTTEINLPEKPIENTSSISSSNTSESINPCIISEDFIKQDLYNPSSADFSMFDCSADKNSDGTYTILRKVSAKNSFGVEKEFIYKLKIGYKGGNWVDMNNWTLINIRSEEYR